MLSHLTAFLTVCQRWACGKQQPSEVISSSNSEPRTSNSEPDYASSPQLHAAQSATTAARLSGARFHRRPAASCEGVNVDSGVVDDGCGFMAAGVDVPVDEASGLGKHGGAVAEL